MSKVRVLVGTRKGAFILTSDGKARTMGRQRPPFRRLGDLSSQGIAGRPEPAVCVAVQRLVRAVDPAFRTMAARRGSRWATSSRTTASPARTSGTTARRIRGSSSASGISNRRSPIRTRSTPEWKTPPCSARPTAGRPGRSSPDCAATARGRTGSRAPAGCACTRSFWIRAIPSGSSSPSRRRARFAPTTAARRGGRSTAD